MKIDNYFTSFALILLIAVLMAGCAWHNEEDLYPQPTACDTLSVTYSATVAPVMQQFCNSCHGSVAPSGGVITDNYTDLSVIAKNGILWQVINHEDGAIPMPQGGNKLSDCNLKKIKIWIEDGSPDN